MRRSDDGLLLVSCWIYTGTCQRLKLCYRFAHKMRCFMQAGNENDNERAALDLDLSPPPRGSVDYATLKYSKGIVLTKGQP